MADAQHSIITPECREGRGDEGAWTEAVERAKAVYDEIVAGWKQSPYQPTLHLRLTIERPVHIRFIEFMPIDVATDWDENSFISSTETREIISRIGTLNPVEHSGKSGPAEMYQLEGAAGQLGFISPLSNHFCDTCNRMRLTADGKLRTCLFSDQEIDLKTFLRSGVSDQSLEQAIAEAIKSKPKGHTISEPSFKKCRRNMSAIGG